MSRTGKLVINAMLAALAYIVYLFMPKITLVPALPFLHYDPKDIVIAIGGFLFGPLSVIAVSVTVSLVEWFTVSTTGHFGFIMNVISTCSFACIPAILYKKNQSFFMLLISLAAGVVAMCLVMLLWNYLIAPFYTGWPRSDIAPLLIPAFLPFNLIKGGINAIITLGIFIQLREILKGRV